MHYSVRSVYAVAARLSHPVNFSATSDNSQNQHFWKQIWSLPLPHKIRHFAWRVCRNILPTKVNLMRRKVVQDDICDECRLEAESSGHLFRTYPKDREVWSFSKLVVSTSSVMCQKFQDLLWNMLMVDRIEVDKVTRVVTIAWAPWHNRNKIKHGDVRKTGNALVS